ncbi:MAG: hypothetical protein GKR98_12065 [Boseongicola sp.]|nr:MAG: hypothetical protein GKR98_12065 [Boseongicola sp.]
MLEAEGRRLSATDPPRLSSYQAFVRAGYELKLHGNIHQSIADYRDIVESDPALEQPA